MVHRYACIACKFSWLVVLVDAYFNMWKMELPRASSIGLFMSMSNTHPWVFAINYPKKKETNWGGGGGGV